jgi:predicted metal-dependent phosphoesterase TrpH
MYCDLHIHSTVSDGTVPPELIPQQAKAAGLSAIALTDHDTTHGLPACAQACLDIGIDFAPGIELSADPNTIDQNASLPPPRGTLHILGLFVRHDDPTLNQIRGKMQAARENRGQNIITKLNQLGVRIQIEEVRRLLASQNVAMVGRPHIAEVLVEKGYAKSIQDAFTRYLGQTGAAYVPRLRLNAQEAIASIHHAGGLAVIAHPVQMRCLDPDHLEFCLSRLKDLGLDGIEVKHSDHTPADSESLEKLAQRLNLLPTGGSDYHGSRAPIDLGNQKVPFSYYERLKERASRTSSTP